MRKRLLARKLWILSLAVLIACGPQNVPPADNPNGGELPPAPTATLTPLNLGGPEMIVGSKWLYVDGSTLVAVPAGAFTMGREGGVDNPQHEVSLSQFWIYRTKVTNGQYRFCVAQGACTQPSLTDNPGYANPLNAADPVTGVTWGQAEDYCGFIYGTLPSEAQWEKAARGPYGNIYPWGDAAPSCALLNFNNCIGDTTNVTTYPQGQSYFEALDMSGNTYEWVSDHYIPDYYVGAPADDPLGPEFGEQRVVRSSAFDSGGSQIPVFSRFFNRPEDHRSNLGFRCVVHNPQQFAPFCNYPAVYGTDGVGGPADGEDIQVACPDLSIDQVLGCQGEQPSTKVTLAGPADSDVSVPEPACSALNSPGSTTCTDYGQLSICSQCTVTTSGAPECPDGYTYDPGTESCVGQPGPGECLPGFIIGGELTRGDVETEGTPTAGQCCVLGPSLGGDLHRGEVFPFCPAGTYYDGQHCISVAVIAPYCKFQGVALNSCQPGGNVCPPEPCAYPTYWDSDKCMCVYPPNW